MVFCCGVAGVAGLLLIVLCMFVSFYFVYIGCAVVFLASFDVLWGARCLAFWFIEFFAGCLWVV